MRRLETIVIVYSNQSFFLLVLSITFQIAWKMTNYGTIPTASSEGTNESISTATQQVSGGIRNGRPWKEMVRSLNLPSGFGDTSDRIKTNLVYFRTNYMVIFMLTIFLSFWFHHFSNTVFLAILIDILVVLYLSNSKLIIILVMISVILLLFTEAAWNIILSLLIEAVVVTAHAIFRKTDDLSLDEESAPAAGLFRTFSSYHCKSVSFNISFYLFAGSCIMKNVSCTKLGTKFFAPLFT